MSGDRIDVLAERLFQAARDERPDAALRRRVREPGAAGATSDAPPASGARSATRKLGRGRAARWLAAAAVLSAAAAVLLFLGKRTLRTELEVRISAEARSPAATAAPLPETASPPSTALAPSSEQRETPPSSAEPTRRAAPPRAPAPLAKRPLAPPASRAATEPAESVRHMPLAEQLTQLKQARALLRSGQSAEALAVLDGYGEQGGTDLRDEALLLRIEALAAQGQREQAAELARRFASEHPDSPLAERARRLGGLR